MHPRSNSENGTQFAAVIDGAAIVVIETSHDESDESQVSPRHSHHHQGADQSPLHTYSMQQMTTQQNVHRQPPRTRTERSAALDNSASSNRQLQPSQRNTGSLRRQITAADAEESNSCSECDDDVDDLQLYRSAIRGVRNAQQARQQMRNSIQHCAVCAKFAAFLENFI
jgi:hypothetical protein